MKNNWVFWISLVISFILILAGFIAPPMGVIDNSVLIAVGMLLGFVVVYQIPYILKSRSLSTKIGDKIQIDFNNED